MESNQATRRVFRWLAAALLATGFGCWPGGAALAEVPSLEAVQEVPRIEVADSETRVLIAKVYLSVGDLVLEDGALVGNYALRVPLRPGKSEGGTLRLPVETDLLRIAREGAELDGRGHSFKEDKPVRKIVATIHPAEQEKKSGELDLWIDVGDRVIEFRSRYELVTEAE